MKSLQLLASSNNHKPITTTHSHTIYIVLHHTCPSPSLTAMCQYYLTLYRCRHHEWAWGRYCSSGQLIQKQCQPIELTAPLEEKRKRILETFHPKMDCEDCRFPLSEEGLEIKQTRKELKERWRKGDVELLELGTSRKHGRGWASRHGNGHGSGLS